MPEPNCTSNSLSSIQKLCNLQITKIIIGKVHNLKLNGRQNIVEDKMCLGNEREEIKPSTSGKGGSQVGREDTVTNATLKV